MLRVFACARGPWQTWEMPDSFASTEETRDVRKTFYLASAIFLLLDDIRSIMGGLTKEQEDALRKIAVRHVELAWDDGAKREADLRTALETETTARKRIQAQLHEALKRISDDRNEPA